MQTQAQLYGVIMLTAFVLFWCSVVPKPCIPISATLALRVHFPMTTVSHSISTFLSLSTLGVNTELTDDQMMGSMVPIDNYFLEPYYFLAVLGTPL